jgi:hypothetical protein
MRIVACLVAALTIGTPVLAQSAAPRLPATGVVVKAATVFWLRDDNRRTIVLLPAGTTVQVIRREGPWYRVIFPTGLGDQQGYMAPYDVRIDPNSGPPERAAVVSQRGFIEARGFGFPQDARSDTVGAVGDVLVRQEAFIKPTRWLQFAAGADFRANSHDQVEDEWRLDYDDRGVLRSRLAVRRLTASVVTSHVSLDLGKQFIRWGRADILSPTDRFAPRDYLNVVDTEFLPVTGVRAAVHSTSETVEVVWMPRMTPSRLPILDQRWTILPPEAAGLMLDDQGSIFPDESQQGIRWSHTGRFEMGISVFDGFNHLPDVNVLIDPDRGALSIARTYPRLRTYGGELSVPTRVATLKGEAAYFTSPTSSSEEYVLYVVEVERQVGEWLLAAGYAGEVVTTSMEGFSFAAERGMARSIIGRASYTVNPRRSVAIESAARQDGRGLYAKGEFSEAFGRHWRLTLAAAGIRGDDDDFLGQYRQNSHVSATLRLSY